MKSSRIVKIFGFFLAASIIALTAFIFMNPVYFMNAEVPSTQNTTHQGQKYFQLYCAACHGARGEGNGPTALTFSKLPPNFLISTQDFKNGLSKEGIKKTLQEGIPETPMPSFQYLSADIQESLIEFIQNLRKEKEI